MVKEEVITKLVKLERMLSTLDKQITDCISLEKQKQYLQYELKLLKLSQTLQYNEKKVKIIVDIQKLKAQHQKPREAVLELGS
ncbi:hypothetical protein WAK64_09200 [Bacillus spongiae]|uniref:Uncharacterized protein n=1 Tax=Bacillus spongiae TaxID=2683610 RepID=A0ABU8HD02_9BACI